VGISLLPRRKKAEPDPKGAQAVAPAPAVHHADLKERLTANDWAKRHSLNEVAAERAAMRAGKWHDLFTEEEFLDLLRRADV